MVLIYSTKLVSRIYTAWHEYGHALHYQGYCDEFPCLDGVCKYVLCFESSTDSAFREGWAAYFGCLSGDCNPSRANSVYEKAYHYKGIFWDIKDDDGDDPVDGPSLPGDSGEVRIWKIIEEKESTNIEEFFDDFTSEYGFEEELCQIYLAHGVCCDGCKDYIPAPTLEPTVQQVNTGEEFTISWSHMYGGIELINQLSLSNDICRATDIICLNSMGIRKLSDVEDEDGELVFIKDIEGTYQYRAYSRNDCGGVERWSEFVTVHVMDESNDKVSTVADAINPTESKLHEVSIDPTISDASFYTLWSGSDLDLVLYAPNGTVIDPSVAAVDPNVEYVENTSYEYYDIHNPVPGIWLMNITAINVSSAGEDYIATVFLTTTDLTLSLSTDKDIYDSPSEPVNIIANLTRNGSPLTGAFVRASIKKQDSVDNITLYDDGLHNDGQANDGVYAILYSNTSVGINTIQVTASGTIDGYQFVREREKSIIVESAYDLAVHPVIIFSNSTPSSGDLITINATVCNIGDVNISNFLVGFYDGDPFENGTIIGVREITETVEVGDNVSTSISWRAKSRVHEIYIRADPYHAVAEINESNNIANRTIYVTPIYNLSIIAAGTDKSICAPNENVTIYCIVENADHDLFSPDIVYAEIENHTFNLSEYSTGCYIGIFNQTSQIGTYNITIYANKTGYVNDTTELSFEVVSENEPPIANFTYSPEKPVVNQTIGFNASYSTDPDGFITDYEWNFGDGNTTNTTEAIINHTYTTSGTYTVNLTVTDNDGATNTTSKIIVVLHPEGGVAVAVRPKVTQTTAGSTVNLSIYIISTENFNDTFHVYLTNENIPDAYKTNLSWFNWLSKDVEIPAKGEATIPLRAIPDESNTKAFKVVVESTKWTQSKAFDTGIFEIS